MSKYLLTYLGGEPPKTPEEGQQHFKRYQEWLGSLGDAVVSPANPIKETHLVSPNGEVKSGGQTGMSGFTVLEADSMDAALEMAKSCPFLEINGNLEVSELIEMQF